MTSEEILAKTADIIRQTVQSGPVPIHRQTQAMDVRGWDSLTHTMVLMQIEDGFGISLPVDRVLALSTVGELVDLIGELLPS